MGHALTHLMARRPIQHAHAAAPLVPQQTTDFRKSRQITGRSPRHLGAGSANGGQEGRGVDGNSERLLTPGEVAALFRVDPKTVTRWAASGRITSIRTPGGHRRFRESEVRALLRGDSEPSPQGSPAA